MSPFRHQAHAARKNTWEEMRLRAPILDNEREDATQAPPTHPSTWFFNILFITRTFHDVTNAKCTTRAPSSQEAWRGGRYQIICPVSTRPRRPLAFIIEVPVTLANPTPLFLFSNDGVASLTAPLTRFFLLG